MARMRIFIVPPDLLLFFATFATCQPAPVGDIHAHVVVVGILPGGTGHPEVATGTGWSRSAIAARSTASRRRDRAGDPEGSGEKPLNNCPLHTNRNLNRNR